jgi:hypothetical protein
MGSHFWIIYGGEISIIHDFIGKYVAVKAPRGVTSPHKIFKNKISCPIFFHLNTKRIKYEKLCSL